MNLEALVCILSGIVIGAILLRKWLWRGCKLVVRTLLGAGALALLSQCSAWTGIALGVNLWNALVLGILGLPGFALLLALQQVTG